MLAAVRGKGFEQVNCFMFKTSPAHSSNWISIRRNAAIGDVLSSTVIADKLLDLGYSISFQCHPSIHCVLRRHPRIQDLREPGGPADVVLDGAYEKHPLRRQSHFHSIWMESANSQLAKLGIHLGPALNCRPRLGLHPNERLAAQAKFKEYPRPWVFVCPRSDWFACRQVPDGIWNEAAQKMHGTKFWLGRHPAPPHFVDLKCQHFDNIIVWLSAADLLVTVDTGPMHVGAALGIPILALGQSSSPELHLSDQVDFLTINCQGLNCLNCQKNICPLPKRSTNPPCQSFNPDFISAWTNKKLQQRFEDRVSAVVPVYGSDPATIKRCLEHALPQVDEIVICAETSDKVPAGIPTDPKIRVVVKGVKRIGYGRNANFGARHTTGKYLLLLNDDVFLSPGAVSKMKEAMRPDVGMVAHLLRYESGLIYPTAMGRNNGDLDWHHIDHQKKASSLPDIVELENCCGASTLVRREAFYAASGFDESFFLYCEDNDFALRLRRGGWKIIYTPHASGIHLGHQSSIKIGNLQDLCRPSIRLFHAKWDRYLQHNRYRVPGSFDYAP
jgi:GT2 family glycosyltransferase